MSFKCLLCKGLRKDSSKVELDEEIVEDWTIKLVLELFFQNIDIEKSSKKACKKCFQRCKNFFDYVESMNLEHDKDPPLRQIDDIEEMDDEETSTNAHVSQQGSPANVIQDKQEMDKEVILDDSADQSAYKNSPDELEIWREKYKTLEGWFTEVEKEKNRLQAENLECKVKIENLKIKNSVLSDEATSCRQQRDDTIEKFTSTKSWKELQNEKESLKKEMDMLKDTAKTLAEKCDQLKAERETAEINFNLSLINREKEWEQKNKELEHRVRSLKKQKAAQNDEIKKLQKDNDHTSCKKLLTEAESKIIQVNERNGQMTNEINDLKAQQSTQTNEYQKFLRKTKAECEHRIKNLEKISSSASGSIEKGSSQKQAATTQKMIKESESVVSLKCVSLTRINPFLTSNK